MSAHSEQAEHRWGIVHNVRQAKSCPLTLTAAIPVGFESEVHVQMPFLSPSHQYQSTENIIP